MDLLLQQTFDSSLFLPDVCKTFGSGVVQMFNGTVFYVHSTCPFTLTRFTHNRVDCDITVRRGENGLLEYVEINVNKIQTRILYNGTIFVEQRMFVFLFTLFYSILILLNDV